MKIMKKLTRYTDFETLKLDVKSDNTSLNRTDKYLHELEGFLKLLRSKLYSGKKINNQKFTDGQ
jgi:hypothetical protein